DGLEGETWPMAFEDLPFRGRFTAFRHVGFFPEQQPNWSWLKTRLQEAPPAFRLLNLFAYTGVASLLAASCGAQTTHLDASKRAIGWARDNAEAAGLSSASVRWICDDAAKFVARERRRGAAYDGIILDPPKYGRGPKGEVWRLLEGLPALLGDCASLLSKEAHFLLLNAYDERLSGPALASLMAEALEGRGGAIEWGELALFEEGGARAIGLSFFARWEGP
ncbi:MAG: class I SAM-dependent methyltransferase, partial [Caulobacteraceae bacterium]